MHSRKKQQVLALKTWKISIKLYGRLMNDGFKTAGIQLALFINTSLQIMETL
jgi:hypothetical protein